MRIFILSFIILLGVGCAPVPASMQIAHVTQCPKPNIPPPPVSPLRSMPNPATRVQFIKACIASLFVEENYANQLRTRLEAYQ